MKALDLMLFAFYAAHYARLQKARGEDYSNMVLAARHYLDNIHSVDRSEFTSTINVIENMLASLEN